MAAIALHPRSAAVHHKGTPDYPLAARLVAELPVPVILTGGLRNRDGILAAFASTGAAAVMLARGSLGNPWLFSSLLADRTHSPSTKEVVAELRWTIARACEHLGRERATKWLRKAYPWYLARLGLDRGAVKALQESLQSAGSLDDVEALLDRLLKDPRAAASLAAAA